MRKRSSGSVRVFYPRFTREQVVEKLRRALPALSGQLALKRLVLFGSYARGTYTAASDIDLLVVYEGSPRGDVYGLVKRAVGLPRLEPHVYSVEEYRAVESTIKRMVEDGIVIYQAGSNADIGQEE